MAEPVVQITCIRNPFDPLVSRETRNFPVGLSMREYSDRFFPVKPAGLDLCVSVNGHLLPETADLDICRPAPGDSISFCAVPKGGGEGGKNILRIVAILALAVVAPMAGAYIAGTALGLTGTALTVGTAVATAGVMAAGGVIINSIFPAKLPQFEGQKGFETSRTYGWNADPNAAEVGAALPELFGTFRVTPPLLARHITIDGDKQYLNMLFAIAGHELDGIDPRSIRINGQPISNFKDIIVNTRLGLNDQEVLADFSRTRVDVPVNVKLSTDWTTRQTETECDIIKVCLIAPQGLWCAKDDGTLGTVEVILDAEYRKLGDTDWVKWLGNTGFLTGQRFREKTSDTQFTITSSDLLNPAEYENGWYAVENDDTKLLKYGTRLRALHSGGYTEHVVAATKILFIDEELPANPPYSAPKTYKRMITRVTVTGTLPEGMTGFQWAPPFEVAAAQNSSKRFTFNLLDPYAGFGQYEYRYRFAIAPPTGTRYGSDVYLDFHEEIGLTALTYPNTALMSIRALATDQLSGSQPRIDVLATRSTVPVWTGEGYEPKPASNPAWACWHILHDARSGGGIPARRIIYSAFEEFAEWCDSKGITCNIYIDSMMHLKQALDTVSMLGRGQVNQVGSKFTVMADKPDTAVQRFLFTMGNIQTDSYNEEWLSGEERADEIEVTYWDAANNHERATVPVRQDGFDTNTGGTNKQSVTLYGCTSRAQAAAHGKFLLNKNRYLTLTASWGADIDALSCFPNSVIDVAHDVPQWGYSGRIVSATDDTVTLDRAVTLDPGKIYAVDIKRSDDSRELKQLVVAETTTTAELALPSPWSVTPEKYDLYTFGEINRQSKAFRVLDISKTSDLRRKLKCLEYVPEIYDDVVVVPPAPPSLLGEVSGFRAVETWTVSPDGSGRSVIDISWRGIDLAWGVFLKQAGGEWERLDTVYGLSYRVTEPLILGNTYTVAVSRTDPEAGASASLTILGKFWAPSDVHNLTAAPQQNGIKISWDHIADIDRKEYILKQGASWEEGAVIAHINSRSFLWEVKPTGEYTFWIAAVDSQGRESENPASYTLSIAVPSLTGLTSGISNGVLRLSWSPSLGQFPIIEYMVSIGASYDSALAVTSVKSTVVSFLVNWSETRRYWITPVDAAGNLGTPSSVDVYIVPPSAPLNIVPQVIYNNALIRWEEPATHTLPIAYYLLKKGDTLGGAISLGQLFATFTIRQELQGGAYTYWIAAVDTAGNTGAWASVNATVDPPQGFILRTDQFLDLSASTVDSSGFTETETGGLLGPVVTGRTWEEHFTDNSWASPDEQIDAGFPFYMQPAGASGYWEQEIDMGALLPGSRVSVTPDITVLTGDPDYSIDISLSEDGISWTDFEDTLEVFGSAFQFVKIKLNAVADSGQTGLLIINSLRLTVSLTKKTDSGSIEALSTDADGTVVEFSEAFIDVSSIGVTPSGTGFASAVYEFSDDPYPSGFKVRVFDKDGNRITRNVSWTASGV